MNTNLTKYIQTSTRSEEILSVKYCYPLASQKTSASYLKGLFDRVSSDKFFSLNMSMQKVKSAYIILGVTACFAIFKVTQRLKKRKSGDEEKLKDDAQTIEALRKPFLQASQLARSLSLEQHDQLMLYGLYKQANNGNASEEKEPSKLNIIAWTKYDAWRKFQGMPRDFAMVKYIEVVEHFNAATDAKSGFRVNGSGEDAVLNMMDQGDIIYEDEQSVDLSEESDENCIKIQNEFSIGAKQSTLCDVSQDFDDGAPLMKAAALGNTVQLRKLIKNGENVNQRDSSGQSALHLAADKGNVDCVTILLDAGADANAADTGGISVLEAAVIGGCVEATKILLNAGANPDQKDNEGDTPRSCAEDDDDPEMMTLFESYSKR